MSNFVPGRRGYEYFTQSDFRGGINHEEENATPGQVLEARNIWSPLGRPETRPGFFGVGQFTRGILVPDDPAPAIADIVLAKEIVATDTFTFAATGVNLDVSGMVAQNPAALGDSWYIGLGNISDNITVKGVVEDRDIASLNLEILTPNVDRIFYKAQYFNGTDFVVFPSVIEIDSTNAFPDPEFQSTFPTLGVLLDNFSFVLPADWESTLLPTVAAGNVDRFWIKFTLFAAPDTSITAATFVSNGGAGAATPQINLTQGPVRGAVAAQLPSQRLYVGVYNALIPTGNPVPNNVEEVRVYTKATDIKRNLQSVYFDTLGTDYWSREPATFAVIPQFNEVYVANDYDMRMLIPGMQTLAEIEAQVETDPFVVGPGAPYAPDLVAQFAEFPRAKFIMWYKNLIWVANLEGNEQEVRWSAATLTKRTGAIVPGYKVFPVSFTFEVLEDDDNSPITGMSSLNEHVLVFKNNSIWRMVNAGTEANKFPLFSAVKVENGVGCISNQSIGKTPLGLMFLGEDGTYLFDGVRTSKMSVAIDDTIHSMNYSAAHLAAGVTWRDNNVYFLALPIAGAGTNNTVIAFDYKYVMRSNEGGIAPAIWIFDNVPAQTWMLDEAESDLEVLYFFDEDGSQFQMDYTRTDNGAPTLSFVQTQRQGFGDWITKEARDLRINSSNTVENLEYELIGDDRNYGSDGPVSFFDFAETPVEGAVFDVDPFSREARRERRVATRVNGEWFTVKVSDNEKGRRMQLHRISIGYVRKGPR